VIAGNYEIIRELGRGAMGVVLLAIDRALQREVALKVIRPECVHPGFAERFAAEARAMASVNHENVVAIHAFGVHDALPYFVMQVVAGETLQVWMTRAAPDTRTSESLSILNDLCKGVTALHQAGTVHRDIKPSNILLDGNLRARIADFGVSTTSRDGDHAEAVFAGTPAYMAPEIAFSTGRSGPVRPSADVYSVACVAYQLLTGRLPVDGESEFALMAQHAVSDVLPPSSARPGLSHAFDRVLLEGLAKNPRERTESVEELRLGLLEARRRSCDPERILVAEDDDDFREALALKLRMEFPTTDVVCVGDGRAALSAAIGKPVSLAILDLQMPEQDGMAVTRALRERPVGGDVPIVILTAAGGPSEWKHLRELGADRFLVKPVDLDDVMVIIRHLLRRRTRATLPSST
jgi:serine/threonine-protein kinase